MSALELKISILGSMAMAVVPKLNIIQKLTTNEIILKKVNFDQRPLNTVAIISKKAMLI